MIISSRHRFIFLKTRKTGSSSVQMALTRICGADDIIVGNDERLDECEGGAIADRNVRRSFTRNGHAELRQLKFALEPEVWDCYLKLAFVRNPWDLVVSRYYWEKKGQGCDMADFRQWVQRYTSDEARERPRLVARSLVRPVWATGGGYVDDLQAPFVLENGRVAIDVVGRYERLGEDFAAICGRLAVATPPLPRLKSSFRPSGGFREAYDGASRRCVERAFAADIEAFGYTF